MAGKKKRNWLLLFISITVIVLIIASQIFGSNVIATSTGRYLYIPTGATYTDVKNIMAKEEILVTTLSFDLLAKAAKYPDKVKPGKYKITHGMSNYKLIRMLRNGAQEPVKLVINKLRTKQYLINFVSERLEAKPDALRALLSDSSYLVAYGLDTNTAMCLIIPDTYEFYWNTNATAFFKKIAKNYTTFWSGKRTEEATAKKLTNTEANIIASLVEEETNMSTDKPLIASVYINRLNKGMPLQADPTVKFALGDFSIKRITGVHLQIVSPYNTYKRTGLPPGPICTPSKKTVDAVLSAPQTAYIYFCAKEDLSGYSNFATNLTDHLKNARAYQQALDERGIH